LNDGKMRPWDTLCVTVDHVGEVTTYLSLNNR